MRRTIGPPALLAIVLLCAVVLRALCLGRSMHVAQWWTMGVDGMEEESAVAGQMKRAPGQSYVDKCEVDK